MKLVDRPTKNGEMEFESLKLSDIDEYGTIAGSNPVLTTKSNKLLHVLLFNYTDR